MVLIGGDAGQKKPQSEIDLERIAASDPRIEYIARAICRARGIDPDYRGFPYPPGPVWEIYIVRARDLIAAFDAMAQWARQHPGYKGPLDAQ